MEIALFGIQREYLEPHRYDLVADSSQRHNILYDNYLEIAENFFVAIRELHEEISVITKSQN